MKEGTAHTGIQENAMSYLSSLKSTLGVNDDWWTSCFFDTGYVCSELLESINEVGNGSFSHSWTPPSRTYFPCLMQRAAASGFMAVPAFPKNRMQTASSVVEALVGS